MKTIFLIGGMGSGKSVVAQCFADLGAPTLDLDRTGHVILRMSNVKRALVEAFGADILDHSGEVNRKVLAASAFSSPEATELLTSITQPAIIAELRIWLGGRIAEGSKFAIVEVSAFDGSRDNYTGIADYIIAVTAPVETRVERAVASGFDEADVRRRIARQPFDGERMLWADYVVENDSTIENACKQVRQIWEKITHAADQG